MTEEQKKQIQELTDLTLNLKTREDLQFIIDKAVFTQLKTELKTDKLEDNKEEMKKLVTFAYIVLTVLLHEKKVILIS